MKTKLNHTLELRELYLLEDGTVEVEVPDLEEYNWRLLLAGKYDDYRDKSANVGRCWMRSHMQRLGVPITI